MSVDVLQEKIRKTKNPSVLELSVATSQIPPHLLQEEEFVFHGKGKDACG